MAKRKNELPWTDGEIITHYRQAANPYVIIGVLADLNDVSKERIRAILKRAGIDPPTKRTKKKQSFKRNHYILVAEDETRYTTGELARKTGHAQSNIWNKAHAKEEITLDGVRYRVIKITEGSTKDGWNYKVRAGNKEPREAVTD